MLPSHSCGLAGTLYKVYTLNDWRKRWDLISLRNVKSEEQARVSGGRLLHARTAATGTARSPRVARWVDETRSIVGSAERRRRRHSETFRIARQ